MIPKAFTFLICWGFLSIGHQAMAQRVPEDLDQHIARSMKVFDVPGVSVAVVKDGQVVLAKGYGVRKLGESESVDQNTMFGIGSNTKAFTTAALATLADEGLISWDDRVYERLPGFVMYDPYVSHEMTIRDLLAHRSGLGLGEGDLLFLYSTYTREEILYKLRFLKPAYSFRSRFGYDNLLYMAAGQVIPTVTGMSWDEYVRKRIFEPLGMANSNVSTTAFKAGLNYAWPHTRVDGKLRVIDFQVLDNVAPAGSINSCAADMAKWIQLQLKHGQFTGREGRLFSEKQAQEMWSAQSIFPMDDPPAQLGALKTSFSEYGLGWMLREYRGHKVVSHGGGVAGFVSDVMLSPDMDLGVVVLSNAEEGNATAAILYHIVDYYLKSPSTDWIASFKTIEEADERDAAEKMRNAANTRDINSKPSLPLPRYAGAYSDIWYGTIHIALEEGHLVARFDHTPTMVGELMHWQYDTFKVHWRNPKIEDAFFIFSLASDGRIDSLKVDAVSPLADFSFDYRDLYFTPTTKLNGNSY